MKESKDKVDELNEYKRGLEYKLDQVEGNINDHEHHIHNLGESYGDAELRRIGKQERLDTLEQEIEDMKHMNIMSNVIDKNTNMTFEFQKLLESYESGNRMFHTISELFYAIPFIVFGYGIREERKLQIGMKMNFNSLISIITFKMSIN